MAQFRIYDFRPLGFGRVEVLSIYGNHVKPYISELLKKIPVCVYVYVYIYIYIYMCV